jgi:TrmH family RNA methyltransferase
VVPVSIDSPQNQHVRLLRSLHDAKGRRATGCFLAEGARLITEALAAGWSIEAAAVCEDLLHPSAAAVAEDLRRGPWQCHALSPRAFRAASAEQTPQGVAIVAQQRPALLADLRPGPRDVVVAAWELRDPGNMGALIRTAEFLGCAGLVAVGDCVDLYDPKTVRATAGAIFRLPLAEASGEGFLAWAKAAGARLVATAMHGGVAPEALALPGPLAVLIGGEAQGLPDAALAAADATVTIPRGGEVESLNAAVAAGICLYCAVRKLHSPPQGDDGEE